MCPEFRRIYLNKENYMIGIEQLTGREREVLALILEANTTKEIARQLSISENTVETHRKNLFIKLEVKNVVGLVNKATIFGNTKRVL